MEDLDPKAFTKLPLDDKVAYALERFKAESRKELKPGTTVVIAGDHSPMKRDEPETVECPECGAKAGLACFDNGENHRARYRAAAILVPGHDTGVVIGYEQHPYPNYPRRLMVQMPYGIVTIDAADATAQKAVAV